MTVQPSRSNRADDDRLLYLLRLRMCHSSSQIAAHIGGISSARVRTLCNRVRNEDVRDSGEDVETVQMGYWRD